MALSHESSPPTGAVHASAPEHRQRGETTGDSGSISVRADPPGGSQPTQRSDSAGEAFVMTRTAGVEDEKVFPFLKLPPELRNWIYELSLAPVSRRKPDGRLNDHVDAVMSLMELRNWVYEVMPTSASRGKPGGHFNDRIDAVTLGNELLLRKKTCRRHAHISIDLKIFASTLSMFGFGYGNCLRVREATQTKPPLRDTVILRLCKQAHAEARDILYSTTTFAVITLITTKTPQNTGQPFHHYLPDGIELSRIQHFRLEVVLKRKNSPEESALHLVDDVFSSFQDMHHLKTLQIVVTYAPRAAEESPTPFQREQLKRVARAIPAHVHKVTWGMTEEERKVGDFSGEAPVNGSVLREIVNAQD